MEEKSVKKQDIDQNQTWGSLALIWAGAVISISGFVVGGGLIASMGFWGAILTTLVGYGFIVVLMILQGIQGSDLKKSAVDVASQVFGKKGAQKVVSTILGISCLGWFGIQTNITGQAFTNFLGSYGIHFPVQLSSLIWGVIMLLTAVFGIKMLNILGKLAIPGLLIITSIVLFNAINQHGFSPVLNFQGDGSIDFITGVSTVIGSFAVGAVIAPDYTRYTRSHSNVVKSSIIGVIPAGVLMVAVGAILTVLSGDSDVTVPFMEYSTPLLGMIAMILATWTTNVTNAFSGGLAITNLFNIPKEKEKITIGISGLIGTILAVVGILDYFAPIMSILTAMIPPVAGVTIASYWIIHRGKTGNNHITEGVNWLGLVSWLIGSATAAVPVILSFFPAAPQLPNNPLIGVIISFTFYLVFYYVNVRQVSIKRIRK